MRMNTEPQKDTNRSAEHTGNEDEILRMTGIVRQTAYNIHTYFGPGFLEKVYENALRHRLEALGIITEQQVPVKVYDADGFVVGEYQVDLLIAKSIIVELKALKSLIPEHEAQLLNYLKATRIRHGVLINFGTVRFQIKKYVL